MTEPVTRARDIEEPTNTWFFHPLSAALVPLFAQWRVTPNMVSIAGMGCGVAAAYFYYHYTQSVFWSWVGLTLMMAWHVLDGADGQLARLTKSQSELGKIIDGICDYVVFLSVYCALGVVLQALYGGQVWLFVISAALCHAAQAGAYEAQRQMYDFWGLGKASAEMPDLQTTVFPAGLVGALSRGYAWVQHRVSGVDREFSNWLYGIVKNQPEQVARLRTAYQSHFAPDVRKWTILCANYRTFGIFIACVFGQPLVYFVWEICILTGVHVYLVYRQRQSNRRFMRAQSALTPA